ncbi:drug resistance transporter, Bcr/CflA subfamily [Methanothrix thermoacetophila PT]|uniref:Drug resistance transporter, Bcr/CflA subfamily n=2 Tax=Methanotrichaceae TaxID=143067 RepID=A0B668_METTP|nr:drug resistance transporter, Bcr/CflA subfamily [Methanothrix thermoacetophila PT]
MADPQNQRSGMNLTYSGRTRQKYLGNKGLIVLISLLSAFVPLSTDLYLPALPGMADYFCVSSDLANLTLTMFFLSFGAGTLLWGPLSDRYGRRPMLLIGLSLYSIASLACAFSTDIHLLIAFRALEGIGGSSGFAVATAMIKDVYDVRSREPILAVVQTMVLISPVSAPVIGAILLKFTTWRGLFEALAFIGLLALAGSIALQETLERRCSGSLLHSLGRLYVVARNPAFASLLLLFSLPSICALAFIASSSYIYIRGFGLSELEYSYFFAFNAIGMISSPTIYLKLSRRMCRRSFVTMCFGVMILSGTLILILGTWSPWIFAVALLPSTIAAGAVRTPGTNLMLEQQREDTGSAAALMSCFGIIAGSIGMTLISMTRENMIPALGMMYMLIGTICAILWHYISKKPYVSHVPDRYATATGS